MADLTKIAELLGLEADADEYDVLTAAEALKDRVESSSRASSPPRTAM